MKTKMKLVTLCALVLLTAACLYGQEKTAVKKAEEEKIKIAIQTLAPRMEKAWNQHNASLFADLFTDDADFTNVVGHATHGKPAIEKFHAPMFQSVFKNSTLKVNEMKVRLLTPTIAAVDFFWSMAGAVGFDGTPWAERRGLGNLVMVDEKGQWLIKVMHNMDLPTGEEKK